MSNGERRSPRPLTRRDVAIVVGLVAILLAVLFLDRSSADGRRSPGVATGHTYRNHKTQVEAKIPGGWRAIRRPIDGVLYPRQVLAASSFPVTVPHHPLGCHPGKVLAQMQSDGVLLQVFEYTPRDAAGKPVRVPRLPKRPRRFHYRQADYGPFECAGLSYRFTFRQSGRAFQAHVWFKRKTVEPRLRAEALQILDTFAPTNRHKADRRSVAIEPIPISPDQAGMRRCPAGQSGGGTDVWARRIGCPEVRSALSRLGAWAANVGQAEGVTQDRDGWTCWSRLEGKDGPVHHICFRGSQLLFFYFN